MNRFTVLPKWVALLFFWIGLGAGICIRSLTLVAQVSPDASAWVWRVAMVSYTFFFGYRYIIGVRRKRIIKDCALIQKVKDSEGLDETTRLGVLYVLNSITRSLELINYAFISMLSIVALILDFFFTR